MKFYLTIKKGMADEAKCRREIVRILRETACKIENPVSAESNQVVRFEDGTRVGCYIFSAETFSYEKYADIFGINNIIAVRRSHRCCRCNGLIGKGTSAHIDRRKPDYTCLSCLDQDILKQQKGL